MLSVRAMGLSTTYSPLALARGSDDGEEEESWPDRARAYAGELDEWREEGVDECMAKAGREKLVGLEGEAG